MFLPVESQNTSSYCYGTSFSKFVPNTVLQMPLTFSPFLRAAKLELLNVTQDCQKIEESKGDVKCAMTPLSLQSNHRKQHKIKKEAYRSKRKIMLKIVKTLKQSTSTAKSHRKYVVQCRYGNQAATFTEVVDESYLLSEEPELLIELLTQARNACN